MRDEQTLVPRKKLLLVCSSGGHLDQALLIKSAFDNYDLVFATFNKEDSRSRLGVDGFYKLFFPTNRNLVNLIRNLVLAVRVIHKEKPHLVFSTGAAVAVPFFLVARLKNIQTVYLECIDRILLPTMTAKLIRPLTNHFICQDDSQMLSWPNTHYLGPSR